MYQPIVHSVDKENETTIHLDEESVFNLGLPPLSGAWREFNKILLIHPAHNERFDA
jgi:hypothetical protein